MKPFVYVAFERVTTTFGVVTGVDVASTTSPPIPVPPVVFKPPILMPKPDVRPATAMKLPLAPVPLPPVVIAVVESVAI